MGLSPGRWTSLIFLYICLLFILFLRVSVNRIRIMRKNTSRIANVAILWGDSKVGILVILAYV